MITTKGNFNQSSWNDFDQNTIQVTETEEKIRTKIRNEGKINTRENIEMLIMHILRLPPKMPTQRATWCHNNVKRKG